MCSNCTSYSIRGVHTLGLSSMSSIDPPTDRPTYIRIYVCSYARRHVARILFLFFSKADSFTWWSHVMLFFVANARHKHDPNIFFVFILYFILSTVYTFIVWNYIICRTTYRRVEYFSLFVDHSSRWNKRIHFKNSCRREEWWTLNVPHVYFFACYLKIREYK